MCIRLEREKGSDENFADHFLAAENDSDGETENNEGKEGG